MNNNDMFDIFVMITKKCICKCYLAGTISWNTETAAISRIVDMLYN